MDATVLAAAGLNRLKISAWPGLRFEFLAIEQVVPAAGQAAIAVQTRAADIDRFEKIMDKETGRAVSLERCFLAELGGGCHLATATHVVGCKMHVFHDTHGYAEFKLRQATVSEENFDVVREVADQYK